MKKLTTVGLAALVAALALGVPAEAQVAFDRTTHLTLEHPVRVPDATLPAGHYVFTVKASDVVWIRNEDDSRVYGPYFTRPIRRVNTTSRPKIVVEGSNSDTVIPNLRGWVGRHRDYGHEFVW